MLSHPEKGGETDTGMIWTFVTSIIGKGITRFGGLPLLTVGMALSLTVGAVAGWKAYDAIHGRCTEKAAERASEAATDELADRREVRTVYRDRVKYIDRYIKPEPCLDDRDVELWNEFLQQ